MYSVLQISRPSSGVNRLHRNLYSMHERILVASEAAGDLEWCGLSE